MKLWWCVDNSEALRSPFQSHLDNLGPRVLGGTTVLSSACGSFACFVNNLICKPDVRLQMWPGYGPMGALDTHSLLPWTEAKILDVGGGGEPVCWRPYGYTQIHPLASPINMHMTRNSLIKSPSSQCPGPSSLVIKQSLTSRQAEAPWPVRFTMASTYLQHKRFQSRKDNNSAGITVLTASLWRIKSNMDVFTWALSSPAEIIVYCHISESALSSKANHAFKDSFIFLMLKVPTFVRLERR